MIRYTTGNLLEADAEALVNTVNTVGVMGKGIALMFKDRFPENFNAYAAACKRGEVEVGRMFVTPRHDLYGPKWIINFPTKQHWRNPSKLEWIVEGLRDLRSVVECNGIRSIAVPPLGAGNGRLEWAVVRAKLEELLADLPDVDVLVYEPVAAYLNVVKKKGITALTPARALIAEIVRRYSILGIECTLLEVQKLAWFIERTTANLALADPLKLDFKPHRYGPYADRLRHLLDGLDGSYLHCEKRIGDAGPFDVIWFDDARRDMLEAYFAAPQGRIYEPALEAATRLIDGFESPLGMELLATVDWLLREGIEPTVEAVTVGIAHWPGGAGAAERKMRIFDQRLIALALDRLSPVPVPV